MSKKIVRLAASLLSIFALLTVMTGCDKAVSTITTSVTPTGEFPVTVSGVQIKAKPQKVFVASADMADIVIALGAETQLAGGANDCVQNELQDLAKADPANETEVSALSPDLILTRSGDPNKEVLSGVAAVVEIAPATTREDFERLYGEVAKALMGDGVGYEKGIKDARTIFTTLDDIERETQSDTVTTGCYLYDLEGSAVTGDMFGSVIMSYSGITNAFSSRSNGEYDLDLLKLSNPNVIFCKPGLKEQIMSGSAYKDLQAVKNKNVFEMEENYMEWQGRTVISAAIAMSEDAFPELMVEATPVPKDPTEEINSKVEQEVKEEEEAAKEYDTLRNGDNNENVKTMQARLSELGYLTVEYDGQFGDVTEQALKDFEKKNAITVDGIADTETLRLLYSDKALKASDPDPAAETAEPTPEATPEPAAE